MPTLNPTPPLAPVGGGNRAAAPARPAGTAGGASPAPACVATPAHLPDPPPATPLPAVPSLSGDRAGPSRRTLVAAGLVAVGALAAHHPPGAAASGLNKYVRKRARTEPLVSYVSPVLDARAQLGRLADAFGDPAEARRLLRSGAFEGLRDNVRAVGEYAAAAAAPAPTLASATDFFAAVQALDFVFFKAARDGVAIPVGEAQARLDAAVAALDALLATVDSDVLRAAAEVVGGVGAPPPAAAAAAAAVPATSPLSQILPQAGG